MNYIRFTVILAVVLAVVASASASAFAATFQYTSYPNMSFGKQEGEHVFKVDGQSFKCTIASFEGNELAEGSASTTVHANYNGCTAFGFQGITVTMNRCHYRFALTGEASGASEVLCGTSGTGDIKTVWSSAFGTCEVEVGEQAGANAPEGLNSYSNIEAGGIKQLKVTSNIKGNRCNRPKRHGHLSTGWHRHAYQCHL